MIERGTFDLKLQKGSAIKMGICGESLFHTLVSSLMRCVCVKPETIGESGNTPPWRRSETV